MKQTQNPFKPKQAQWKKLPLSKLRYRAKLTEQLKEVGTIEQQALASFMIRNTISQYRDTNRYDFGDLKKRFAVGPYWRVRRGSLQLWNQLRNEWGSVVYSGEYNNGIGKTICEAVYYQRISFNDMKLWVEGKHDGTRQFET
jgi:hypothetical protein